MGKLDGASRKDLFCVLPEALTLVTDEQHPLYDSRVKNPLDEKLVLNVMHEGIIQPISCKREGDNILVAAGRQRVRAAIEANKRLKAAGKELIKVPIVIRQGNEKVMFGIMISENELRRDDDPLTKSDKLVRYQQITQAGDEEAAVVFGVDVQTVKNWQKLKGCVVDVRKAVERGQIPATAAARLSGKASEEQKKALQELLESGRPTVANAERVASGKKAETKKTRKPGRKVLLDAIEDENTPSEARDILRWVCGLAKRPW